jgi:uncharacterized membrane protein YecN with MAPEG domain
MLMVTPLYAGLLAIWYLVLSYKVVQRRGHGFALGDCGDATMLRLMRGHANFAEYVPYILLMMGLLELGRFSIYVIHALGLTLLVARVLHGISLSFTDKWMFGRYWGTALTFGLLLVCGVLCIYQGVQAHWFWCCLRT